MPLPRGRLGTATLGLISVTVEETEAVTQAFDLRTRVAGTGYTAIQVVGEDRSFHIVHRRLPNQTNVISVQTAGDIIEDFRPQYILLIGTAGGHSGRDGVALGDVVVANYLDYSGYWKYKEGAVLERKLPHDHPSGHLLENYVEPLRARPETWNRRITAPRPESGAARAFVGNVVSGNNLLGDPDNREQRRILDHFDKAYAFEMEGYGISSAVYKARSSVTYNPQYLLVRGISDLVDRDAAENQQQRQQWTPYAAASAAAFARVLVEDILRVGGYELHPIELGGQRA